MKASHYFPRNSSQNPFESLLQPPKTLIIFPSKPSKNRQTPVPVRQHCIPRILAGDDVLGLAQTGSGKTAAFELPILHRLAEDPYGVFALVLTPTRELAYQFRALGSSLQLRCVVVVGGLDMINQAQPLTQRPHVVITTPGRAKVLLEENPDIPAVFSKAKNDIALVHEIEAVIEKQLELFECKENEVLVDITKVYKAKRVATMKMMDDGFEKAKARKAQKLKTLAEKGLLKKKSSKRKSAKLPRQSKI